MKVEIEIPDPPEGWVYDGFRMAKQGELYYRDGKWWWACTRRTKTLYPVAVKQGGAE
jgi:hypothetical protein